jgi:uncharacterized protein (DUF488 family)
MDTRCHISVRSPSSDERIGYSKTPVNFYHVPEAGILQEPTDKLSCLRDYNKTKTVNKR